MIDTKYLKLLIYDGIVQGGSIVIYRQNTTKNINAVFFNLNEKNETNQELLNFKMNSFLRNEDGEVVFCYFVPRVNFEDFIDVNKISNLDENKQIKLFDIFIEDLIHKTFKHIESDLKADNIEIKGDKQNAII